MTIGQILDMGLQQYAVSLTPGQLFEALALTFGGLFMFFSMTALTVELIKNFFS